MHMIQFTDLISVPEAAKQMDLNPETIRRHIRVGTLVALKIGQQWFLTKEEADAFLSKYDRRTGRIDEL
jgi:excisionase family DNA binding protein